MSYREPRPIFESSNSNDCDDDSDDSDELEYYNIPTFSAPPPPPQPPQPTPSPKSREIPERPNGSPGPIHRPTPPPRSRRNNSARVQSMASPPMSECWQGQAMDNRTYSYSNKVSQRNTAVVGTNGSSQDNNNVGVEKSPWYWGDISRSDAEQTLKNYSDGSFLVRDSTTPGDYALTVRKDGQSKCLKIYHKEGRFGLKVGEYLFSSVPALIENYKHHSLAGFNRRLDLTLKSFPPKKTKNISAEYNYETLSNLANVGRELQKAKQQYIELTEHQVKFAEELHLAQIRERASKLAESMFSQLLAPPPSGSEDLIMAGDMSPERQKMLKENRTLAEERYASIKDTASRVFFEAERCEHFSNEASIKINDHVERLRDIEESCDNMRKQLIEAGAKRDLVECLSEEVTGPYPDQSLWLVNCTREKAEEFLQSQPAGTYLIRPKDDKPDIPYALSIVSYGEDGTTGVKHCTIHRPNGRGYGFRADGAVFESIDELVCKHSRISIKVYFTHMDTCLVHPIFGERPKSLGEISDNSLYLDTD